MKDLISREELRSMERNAQTVRITTVEELDGMIERVKHLGLDEEIVFKVTPDTYHLVSEVRAYCRALGYSEFFQPELEFFWIGDLITEGGE